MLGIIGINNNARRCIAFIPLAVLVRLPAKDRRASLRWNMRRSIGFMDDGEYASIQCLVAGCWRFALVL